MPSWREKEIWCEGGAIVLRRAEDGTIKRSFRDREGNSVELGEGGETGDGPLPVHISRGNFPNERPRYISGLARYAGDANAYCRSDAEVHAKARMQGKEVVRSDTIADTHPIHRHNGPWGRGW